MFNLGGGEILVILLLALIVLGPQRLPEAARKLGTAVGEVRRMATGFQNEIKAALDDAEITTGSTQATNRARPATRAALTAEAGSTATPPTAETADGPDLADLVQAEPADMADVPAVTGEPPDPADLADIVEPSADRSRGANDEAAMTPDPAAPGRDDAVA
ncbi:MAG: Sec-independent protein translocase protein TatB [Acidimicrobiales bacterium]